MKTRFTITLVFMAMIQLPSYSQVPNYVPSDSLEAWYPFNGNAIDATVNTYDATVSGATLTTDRFSNANSAYNFDGAANQILVPSGMLLNSQDFAIAGWFYSNAAQVNFSNILQIDVNNPIITNPNNNIFLRYEGGMSNFRAVLGIGGAGTIITPTTPSSGVWYHFVLNYTGTNFQLYLNGTLVGQNAYTGVFQSADVPIYLGNWNTVEGFNGKIDDVGIWNKALSDCEINQLYNSYYNTNTLNPTICQGEIFNVGISSYSTPGVFHDTLTAANGCDSAITTSLTVIPSSTFAQSISICQGDFITVGSSTYTANGIYNDTLSAFTGCDSIITTSLTVNSIFSINNPITICQGETYNVAGNTYSSPGTYVDTINTIHGCDSVIHTNLSVLLNNSFSQSPTICIGSNFIVGTSTYSTPGNYSDTLMAANGCDSIISTNLSVLDCSGLEDQFVTALEVYPNPTNGILYIKNETLNGELILFDAAGKQLKVFNRNSTNSFMDISEFAPGIYYLMLNSTVNVKPIMLLKN